MVLLALDQSSHITGFSVFKDGELINSGKFTLENKDIGNRLVRVRKNIEDLLFQFDVTEVVYEDIQLQTNVENNIQTFKILAEVVGVVEEVLTEHKIPHRSYLASQWKSTLGIRGHNRYEQKKNAQKYVIEHYGKKVTQDEADSTCLGLHYLAEKRNDWSK